MKVYIIVNCLNECLNHLSINFFIPSVLLLTFTHSNLQLYILSVRTQHVNGFLIKYLFYFLTFCQISWTTLKLLHVPLGKSRTYKNPWLGITHITARLLQMKQCYDSALNSNLSVVTRQERLWGSLLSFSSPKSAHKPTFLLCLSFALLCVWPHTVACIGCI